MSSHGRAAFIPATKEMCAVQDRERERTSNHIWCDTATSNGPRLVAFKETGRKELQEFVTERSDTNETRFWASVTKKNIRQGSNIQHRLIVASKARDVNLREALHLSFITMEQIHRKSK
ncbi:hypothetical protein LSAT2_017121 [Lamellibrachia satsuma]|nr:hypothetical protein LSAT2_017121 [Lamellibrachia satsuma]